MAREMKKETLSLSIAAVDERVDGRNDSVIVGFRRLQSRRHRAAGRWAEKEDQILGGNVASSGIKQPLLHCKGVTYPATQPCGGQPVAIDSDDDRPISHTPFSKSGLNSSRECL